MAVLHSETFQTPGPLNRYGFPFFYGEVGEGDGTGNGSGQTGRWTFQHISGGNWDGSDCARLTILSANQTEQCSMGWGIINLPGADFEEGESVFLRARCRWRSNCRWEGTQTQQNKFFMWGEDEDVPYQSRCLVMTMMPGGTPWGLLGGNTYDPSAWSDPSDFGLSVPGNVWSHASVAGRYGSLGAWQNIGNNSAGPALITYADNPVYPASKNGAAPIDGWIHWQAEYKSGNGNAQIKFWVNNNNYNAPLSATPADFSLGVVGWHGYVIGGHITAFPAADYSIDIGGCEVAEEFDPTWYPAAASEIAHRRVGFVRR